MIILGIKDQYHYNHTLKTNERLLLTNNPEEPNTDTIILYQTTKINRGRHRAIINDKYYDIFLEYYIKGTEKITTHWTATIEKELREYEINHPPHQ